MKSRDRLEINTYIPCATKLPAHLEYYLGLYDDAERSISRALELGHEDDGSLQVRLARIYVRRHKSDSANAQRHLCAALAAFSEALKFVAVASKAVHYLEVKKGTFLSLIKPSNMVHEFVRNVASILRKALLEKIWNGIHANCTSSSPSFSVTQFCAM